MEVWQKVFLFILVMSVPTALLCASMFKHGVIGTNNTNNIDDNPKE
jgi:hypothetical protein